MFKSCENKGFQLTFENGWTISVQWSPGSYCHAIQGDDTPDTTKVWTSPDAEIAIWDSTGEWYNFGSDEVKGYCTADEVAHWISFTRYQQPVQVMGQKDPVEPLVEKFESLTVELEELASLLGVTVKKVAKPDNSSDL